MKVRYLFFIVVFFAALNHNASADNYGILKKDTIKSDSAKTIHTDTTHFLFNNIISNPAYTGMFKGQNFMIRTEFACPMIETNLNTPQQYIATYDASLGKKDKNAIGFYFSKDLSGAIENLLVGCSFDFKLDLTPKSTFYNKLNIGLSVSYNQMSIDYKKLTWGDQIDPSLGFIYYTQEPVPGIISKSYTDLILGLWYSNPYFYFGASARNIISPDSFKFVPLPLRVDIACGGYISLNKSLSLSPSVNAVIIKGFNGLLNSYDPALMFTYRHKYIAGFSYKDLNKITFNAGYVLFDRLRISAACGFFTNSDLYQFGTLGFVGGEIRYNIKNGKNENN
jgi:type IX secretion system PorP/SprF family membrane protein